MQQAEGICNKLYGKRPDKFAGASPQINHLLVRWTQIGWKDYMAVLARALEVATKHHIPKVQMPIHVMQRFEGRLFCHRITC